MKCPACQFNNMPGNVSCARCNARMEAPAGESFMPPRPTERQRLMRRLSRPIMRPATSSRTGDSPPRRDRGRRAAQWLRRFVNPDLTVPWYRSSPVLAGLFSALVPGAGHLYLGRVVRALPLLAGACILAAIATRYLWVPLGTWTLGAYCMLGGWAVLDCALRLPSVSLWQRYLLGIALVSALWLVMQPVAVRLNQLWPTHIVVAQSPVGSLPPGAQMEFDRHAYDHALPRIGELVLTRAGQVNVVLGGPEDFVEWNGHELSINGVVQPGLAPLRTGATHPPFRALVPADHYLVLPRAYGGGVGETHTYESLVIPQAMVPRRDVLYRYVGQLPLELPSD